MTDEICLPDKYTVTPIKKAECHSWILDKHYARRMPSVSYAFGLYDSVGLRGICTVGKPASPSLCVGVCGESESTYVYELNRLCVESGLPSNSLSFFVGGMLRLLPPLIIVSYADTAWGHHGYIYQATNWIYTGMSARRTDPVSNGDNRHARHDYRTKSHDGVQLEQRSRKHRYVYFTGTKRHKKRWRKLLNYPEQAYPKGANKRYNAPDVNTTQQVMFL